MKNLHSFLTGCSHCPICKQNVFTEVSVTFDAITKRNSVPFKLDIQYIRETDNLSYFKYVKYRDDDDRRYDPGFDRASNYFIVSRDGSFIFDNNAFAPNSFSVFGYCPDDHFIIETREVYLHSDVEEHKVIRMYREEMQLKNYKIINDYAANQTKVYVNDTFPAKLTLKLTPFYNVRENSTNDIVSKIESLLILS